MLTIDGYMLIEKTRNAFIRKRLAAICSGGSMVLVSASLLNLMFFRGAGIFLINIEQLVILLLVGIITSGLGGSLAIRYFNLNQS